MYSLGFHFLLTSDVEIGFSPTTYNVSEGASATVTVAVVSGTPDRDITVSLSTVAGTATGRGRLFSVESCVQQSDSHNPKVVKPWCYNLYLLCIRRRTMPYADWKQLSRSFMTVGS